MTKHKRQRFGITSMSTLLFCVCAQNAGVDPENSMVDSDNQEKKRKSTAFYVKYF